MAAFQLTLSNKNLRLFFIGQGLANIGNLINQVAVSWLAYTLTDSAIMLAIVMFSREIAATFTSPFAGVLADRFNKKKLLILAGVLLMCSTSLLGLMTISGWVEVSTMIFFQIIFGLISGVEIPTRQAFVNELVVNKEHLTNAIAFNSTLFNTARIVGPAIAGILIPFIGEGFCFIAYGVMLFVITFIFIYIQYQPLPAREQAKDFSKEFWEGFSYSFQSPPIRVLLILIAIVTVFGLSYEILLPIFADQVFDKVLKFNSNTFGYMLSAVGVGSIFGGVHLSMRKNLIGLEKVLFAGALIFGVFITLFSFTDIYWLALCLLFLAGYGRVLVFTAFNTLLQTIAEDEKRGRVLSLYIMIFMFCKTIGNLIMGFIAEHQGVNFATGLGGVCCIFGVIFLYPQMSLISKAVSNFQQKIQEEKNIKLESSK
ncbi:MAG: MFS transporter [Microscillaceae bacterium]|nr:MFS transporter [Microscillaceae bacterium]